jgi:lipopolysaccharide/colanic/teichoic acid biosynthesis glycosyltransferase
VASSFALAADTTDDGEGGARLVRAENAAAVRGSHTIRRGWDVVVKRVMDVVLASLALAVATPVLALAAVAIRIESSGQAIFRQQRLGRDGRPFTMFKLRTMVTRNDDSAHRNYVAALMNGDGEKHDGIYKLTNDPRLTRVGRILRRTSLDEVPQLLNVIRGEMSLVGPRPPLPSEVELYDERDCGRLAQRPGITGLWQVSGRCELTYRQMIELDLRYVREWSLGLDVRILLRTPRAIASQRGAA